MRDEARDEESELGLNNNGMRDEASDEERSETREEEKCFLFGRLGLFFLVLFYLGG
jgi:hypothetical protein